MKLDNPHPPTIGCNCDRCLADFFRPDPFTGRRPDSGPQRAPSAAPSRSSLPDDLRPSDDGA